MGTCSKKFQKLKKEDSVKVKVDTKKQDRGDAEDGKKTEMNLKAISK